MLNIFIYTTCTIVICTMFYLIYRDKKGWETCHRIIKEGVEDSNRMYEKSLKDKK